MTSEKKTRVAVLFGGVSSEHEISLMSVESVLANLPDHYEVLRIGITKDGRWVEYTGRNDEITSQKWEQDPTLRTAIVSPDRSHKGVLLLSLEYWNDVHPSIVTVPLEGCGSQAFGLLYPLSPLAEVERFARIIEEGTSPR